jgi:hypothetical protein
MSAVRRTLVAVMAGGVAVVAIASSAPLLFSSSMPWWTRAVPVLLATRFDGRPTAVPTRADLPAAQPRASVLPQARIELDPPELPSIATLIDSAAAVPPVPPPADAADTSPAPVPEAMEPTVRDEEAPIDFAKLSQELRGMADALERFNAKLRHALDERRRALESPQERRQDDESGGANTHGSDHP